MDGDGVYVDARDRRSQFVEYFFGQKPGLSGRIYEVGDCLGDERAGAAGGVEHPLIQRVGHHLADHGAREPVGGVVLA